jgi:integrase
MAALKADKGKLVLDFTWKGVRCREYLALDDTKDGRARARQVKLIVEGEVAARTLDFAARFPRSRKVKPGGPFAPPPPPTAPAGPPTFGTFSREWLELQRPFGSRAHYLDRQSLLETHLLPFFGADRPMSVFAVEDVERFVGHLKTLPGLKGGALSGVRVNKARNLLRKILDRAVRNGWLKDNPVLEVARLREDPAEIDPLSWKEVALLLDKGLKHDPEMRRFYTVEFFTGLRTSELIGLKWTDIDWTSDTPVAHIKRSFTKHDGEHLTKTAGSARAVDLRPQVVRALKEQQASSRLKGELVFPNSIGGPLDRDNLMNRVWYPALKRAGLRERKPYQTRHTFATLALSAGEEIGWTARQLGHVNTAMVIRHYYRFIKNNTRQDGSAFDKAAASAGL